MGKKKSVMAGPASRRKKTGPLRRVAGPRSKSTTNLLAHHLLYTTPEILLHRETTMATPPEEDKVSPKKKKGVKRGRKICWICKAPCYTENPSLMELDIGQFKQRVFTPSFLKSFIHKMPPSVGEWPCNKCAQVVNRVTNMTQQIVHLETLVREEVLRVRAFMKLNWNLEQDADKNHIPAHIVNAVRTMELQILENDPLMDEEEDENEAFFEPPPPPFSNYGDNYSDEDIEDVKPFVLDQLDIDDMQPPITEDFKICLEKLSLSPVNKITSPKPASRKRKQDEELVTKFAADSEFLPQKRKSKAKAEKLVQRLALEDLEDDEEQTDETEAAFEVSDDKNDDDENTHAHNVKPLKKKVKLRKPKKRKDGKPTRKRRKKEDIPQGPFLCSKCNKCFRSQRNVFIHQVTVCKMEIAPQLLEEYRIQFHQCETCGKKFADAKDLGKHILVHTGEKPFSCSKCGMKFTQKVTLKKHQEDICVEDDELKKQKRLDYLKKFHSKERPFKCSLCPRRFIHEKNLLTHRDAHFTKNKKANRTPNGKIPCHICGRLLGDEYTYRIHVQRVHDGVRRFPCSKCPRSFYQTNELKRHVQRMHEKDPSAPPKIPEFICEICGQKFLEKVYLENHTKRVHERTMNFECDICHKKFHAKHELKVHGRSHARKGQLKTGDGVIANLDPAVKSDPQPPSIQIPSVPF